MPERQLRMIRPHLDGLPDYTVPEGYALRTFQPGDEAAWCAIMHTGLGADWTVERCQQQLTSLDRFRPEGLFFVTHDGQPVGSACAWPDSPEDPRRAQVHMVCVMPDHRGKGLGWLVTLAVLHYMRDHGFQASYLFTDDFRIPAIKTYVGLGFEPDYLEESHRPRWAAVFAKIGQAGRWWRHIRPEPASHRFQETSGNRVLLVILDRAQREACDRARRTVIPALHHYGMPYRVLDVTAAREPAQAIASHQAIVLAQEGIGDSLSAVMARQIARAVADGAGLISFDHRIDRYPEPLAPLIPATADRTAHETRAVTVPVSDHFITGMRHTNRLHRFRRPVALACAVIAPAGRILMETDEQMPVLLAATYGSGRIVQYLLNPRVWDPAYGGHGEGLDDVFWRSIVWAARKPFVMSAMPPFVTFRVLQASGAADGFGWLASLVDRGWRPHVGLLTQKLYSAEWQTLARLVETGRVECFPQALTEGAGLYFDHEQGHPLSDEEVRSRLEQVRAQFDEHGIPVARSFHPYRGEYGRNVMPHLAGWNVGYSLTPFLPGEAAHADHLNWEPEPYGHPGFIMDRLLGFPDIFVAVSAGLEENRMADGEDRRYRLAETQHSPAEDVLEPAAGASRTMRIVEQAARTIRRGLDARFYGTVTLNERDILALTAEEWEGVLDHLDLLIREYGAVKMSQDAVSMYARSKAESRLSHVNHDHGTNTLHIVLTGAASVPPQIQVFDENCREHPFVFDPFEGRLEETITPGGVA
jgi:GNAT superfamily N-acetyltransferase